MSNKCNYRTENRLTRKLLVQEQQQDTKYKDMDITLITSY